MSSLALTLPYPPTTNHLYATVNGRRVLSRQGRQYKTEVEWLARQAMGQAGIAPYQKGEALILTWRIAMPDNRRRDLTNCLKAVEDALTSAHVWHDDSQITEHHIYKEIHPGNGHIRLEIHQRHTA